MNVVKKNRLEEAKLAKAYMAGGMAPYQAARKCGFMRVAVMEEAIRELENKEAADAAPAVTEGVSQEDQSRYLGGSVPAESFPPPPPKQPVYAPEKEFRNSVAVVLKYGENGNHAPAYRVNLVGRPGYMVIPETQFDAFVRLVAEAAGMKAADNNHLLEELANEREVSFSEAKQHLAELQRNEALQAENARLAELQRNEALQAENARLAELAVSLEAQLTQEQEKHNALKLRVFDILLSEHDRSK